MLLYGRQRSNQPYGNDIAGVFAHVPEEAALQLGGCVEYSGWNILGVRTHTFLGTKPEGYLKLRCSSHRNEVILYRNC